MKNECFVGITGISTLNEVSEIINLLKIYQHIERKFNIGILLSSKILFDEVEPLKRFPKIEIFYSLLQKISESQIYNSIIHYNSQHSLSLFSQIEKIFAFQDIYQRNICRKIQLNIKNPDVIELQKVKNKYSDMKIILQIPLWKEEFKHFEILKHFISQYFDFCDYFLCDFSGGRGREMNFDYLEVIKNLKIESKKLVFAGGLNASNVEKTIFAIKNALKTSEFSIDAEGKLRGGTFLGKKVGDNINFAKVKEYLEKSINSF